MNEPEEDFAAEVTEYLLGVEAGLLRCMRPVQHAAVEGLNKGSEPSLIEELAMLTVSTLLGHGRLSVQHRSDLAFLLVVAHRNLERANDLAREVAELKKQLGQTGETETHAECNDEKERA